MKPIWHINTHMLLRHIDIIIGNEMKLLDGWYFVNEGYVCVYGSNNDKGHIMNKSLVKNCNVVWYEFLLWRRMVDIDWISENIIMYFNIWIVVTKHALLSLRRVGKADMFGVSDWNDDTHDICSFEWNV